MQLTLNQNKIIVSETGNLFTFNKNKIQNKIEKKKVSAVQEKISNRVILPYNSRLVIKREVYDY